MFWGPFTGAASRGMRRGYNNNPSDDWAEWRAWPIHAVSLSTTGTDWTSSSRIVTPSTEVFYYGSRPPADQLEYDIQLFPCPGGHIPVEDWQVAPTENAAAVLVRVCGDIPAQTHQFQVGPTQVLHAPMPYSRVFYVDEDGVRIKTTIQPSPADVFAEAWETIPLYDQFVASRTNYAGTQILLIDGNGVGQLASPGIAPVPNITSVYVTRAEGAFRIVFDTPQVVGLSAEWSKGEAVSCNLMIDLGYGHLPAALPSNLVVGYRIEMMTDAQGTVLPP